MSNDSALAANLNATQTLAVIAASPCRGEKWSRYLSALPGVVVVGTWASVEAARRAGVTFDAILLDGRQALRAGMRADDVPLSRRETQVMRLLAGGCRDKELPARLHVSAHTARTFVRRAMVKLGASSRAEAIALWVRRAPPHEHEPDC